MLRRRPDNTFEFREVERMLYSIQPPALAPERKDALRARIMESLGEQEALRQAGILTPAFRERWVAVPAGVGIAAAIIGGIYLQRGLTDTTGSDHGEATFAGQLNLDGAPVNAIRPGPTFVAAMYTHVSLGGDVALMLQTGTSFRYEERDGEVTVYTGEGLATLATGDRPANLVGANWSARLSVNSSAEFLVSAQMVTVNGISGVVSVVHGAGVASALTAGDTVTFSLGEPARPEITPPADPFGGNGNAQPPAGAGAVNSNESDEDAQPPAHAAPPKATPVVPDVPPTTKPPVAPPAKGETERPETPADPQGPPADVPPAGPVNPDDEPPVEPDVPAEPPVTPPGPPATPPGQGGEPPADPPGQGDPGEPGPPDDPGPPEDPGEQGNGNGPGSNNGNGNGNGPGSNNGNGNANGPGSNNGNGNANGPGSNNGNGNAVGPGENGGQGQGNGNGNQGLVLAVSADSSSDGDAEEAATSDAGPGNGNGNAFGHENAPGQAKSGVEPGNGNGPGANNGNAATNPGKGKGPAHK